MAKLSKRDYDAIADLLRDHFDEDNDDEALVTNITVSLIGTSLADWFGQGNPQFNRDEFLKNVGIFVPDERGD